MSSTKNYHFSRAAPPALSCYVKGFPLKANSFRNTSTYQKLWRGVPSPPPPVPPRGYEFACTSVGQCISYFNYFSLLVHRFAVRISLPFIWYCIKLFLPIQEPTTEAPSTRIRFCLKTEFFPLWFRLSFTCNQ